MKLPQTIDKRALSSLAPQDTHAVRVIVRRVLNQTPFRVRGKARHYLFEWDYQLQAHILDIPQSAWMAEFPASGPYRDNASVAHDLQGSRSPNAAPLVFLLVPWSGHAGSTATAAEIAAAPDFIGPIREMLVKLKAPEIVLRALSLARGPDNSELLEFISGIPDDPAENLVPIAATASEINPKTGEPYTPAALRMRAMRERKKTVPTPKTPT